MTDLEPARAVASCLLLLSSLWGPCLAHGSYERATQEEIPLCNCQTTPYPPRAFSIWASYNCYRYLNPDLIKPNAKIKPSACNITVPNRNSSYTVVPCYISPVTGDQLNFDHKDPRVLDLVSRTLRKYKDGQKWLKCSEAADDCCDAMLEAAKSRRGKPEDEVRCPPQWDSWYCWVNGGTPGTQERGVCPDYIYSSDAPTCKHHQTKECFKNGTWRAKTDYSTCSVTPQISTRTVYHVVVLAISLITAIPALIIFFSYRKLKVMRVIHHRTLILAIAARNCFTIISSTTVILPELNEASHGVMEDNGVPCRVLATFERLAANAVFACMLLEGFHLHRLIAAAFQAETFTTPAFIIAAALTFLPTIAWAAVMATLHDSNCWYVDSEDSGYQWINDGPRIAMLAINTLFLLDILRVMLTKLRSAKSANAGKVQRAAKATLFLMPLFGVQLLFTVARPSTEDCVVEQVYYFFAYTTDGLQGFFVVLIYCFLNKEVRELLGRSWRVWSDKVGISEMGREADLTSRRATLLTSLPVPKTADVPSENSVSRNSLPSRRDDNELGNGMTRSSAYQIESL